MNINEFQKQIGYFFKDEKLLEAAFTHTSYGNENGTANYQRLEFLGDAIVDFIVGEYLFRNYPQMNEGEMSRIRASLVCEKMLAKLALNLNLNEYILLGKGAELSGDRMRSSILSDVFEAHIAAMFLDNGFENTRDYLLSIYGEDIDNAAKENAFDYKTLLQEKLQRNGQCEIEYKLLDAEGPVHHCMFTFSVSSDGKELGRGAALSKKEAQQIAAKNALNNL